MSYHPCPVCQASRHGGRWRRQVAKPLPANSKFKEQKSVGVVYSQPRLTLCYERTALIASATATDNRPTAPKTLWNTVGAPS